jgi:ABC-2 type transport system permease protein
MAHALDAAAGTIYDIGYRSYEGARLGRGYAFRTLYVHSLRSVFGLGRGGRALIFPWALFAAMIFPAVVTTAVAGISGGMMNKLIDYHEIYQWDAMMLALFCAAQAPELVSRDHYHRVLPLYFSRALRKRDYALAKLLAMWTAVFLVMVSPLLVILTGRLGLPSDFGAAFKQESKDFFAIVATPAICALVFGTLSLAIASYIPRRGIASAAVLGTVLLTAPLANILMETADDTWGRYGILLNPILVASGAIFDLFHERPDRGGLLRRAHLPPEVFYGAVAAYAVVFLLLLLNRYRKISA